MQTGEDEKSLRKIMDMTRMLGIVVLLLHSYYYCYGAFQEWHLTAPIGDRILANIARTGLFHHFHTSKLIALGCLVLSLIGTRGRKSEKLNYRMALAYLVAGLCFILQQRPAPIFVRAGHRRCRGLFWGHGPGLYPGDQRRGDPDPDHQREAQPERV
jgi:hypothetical protein